MTTSPLPIPSNGAPDLKVIFSICAQASRWPLNLKAVQVGKSIQSQSIHRHKLIAALPVWT